MSDPLAPAPAPAPASTTVTFRAPTSDAALRMNWLAATSMRRFNGILSRARMLRLFVVIALTPVVAWLAHSLGLSLEFSICTLIVLGPILWFGLGLAFAGLMAGARLNKIRDDMKDLQVPTGGDPAEEKEVSMTISEKEILFQFDGHERRYPPSTWSGAVLASNALVLSFTDNTGWMIPASAFPNVHAVAALVKAITTRVSITTSRR